MTDPKLKSFVERYERLAEERKAIGSDMGDVLSEAEGVGYDKAGIRRLVAWRAMNAADRQEREITDDMYRAALEGAPIPDLAGVKPVDPVLQRAIDMYRAGATVREVQAAFKAEGHKMALGTAHKLRKRAKPFLDAEKAAALKAHRPTATVHVHPSVNVNTTPHDPETGEINGEEDTERHVERTGQEDPVCGQPDSEDAGGDAGTVRGLGDGEDDNREDDCGAGGEGQAELAPPPTTNADGMEIPPFLRRERASA